MYEQKAQTEILDGQNKTAKEDDVPQSKHARVATENSTKKKTSVAVSQGKKLGEVQEICEKLKSKHASYDQERIRMWHGLFKDGAITEEYEQQKEKILGDFEFEQSYMITIHIQHIQ